jgi:c-di-GMP-binding flagellar brake protein YcgR
MPETQLPPLANPGPFIASPLTVKHEMTVQWATDESVGTARATVANLLRQWIWLDLGRTDAEVGQLPAGQLVRISFAHGQDKYCTADVPFGEMIRRRPLRVSVARPDRVRLVQRRAFFRMKIAVPVVVVGKVGADEADEEVEEPVGLETTTDDLGGGGLRLVTRLDMKLHERYIVRLECPPGNWIEAGAEVVRIDPLGTHEGGDDLHLGVARGVALAFVRILLREQDRIVAYLFAEQRRQRQRG